MPTNFMEIDLDKLEQHWVEQTRYYNKYAKLQAEAKQTLMDAQAYKEWAEAESKKRIRRNPNKYRLNKITEPAVKEAMVLHPLYRKAMRELNDAQNGVDVLTGVLRTLEHRKATLENLVVLHGQNYFSKPRAPNGYDRDMESSMNIANRTVRNKKLRKRLKKK